MRHKMKAVLLALMLVLVPLGPVVRAQNWDARGVAKIKADVTKRVSAGKIAIKIKLLNGSELHGQISQASDREFTLTEDKTEKSFTIAYADVSDLKGRGFSTGKKIGIIAAVTVGLLLTVFVIGRHKFDPFKNGVLR